MKSEDMYVRFKSAMENVTVFIATCSDTLTGDVQAAPEKVTVTFGSSLHGWNFNVQRSAAIYASKTGVDKEKMAKRLRGDKYFNVKKKTSTNVQQNEDCNKPLQRVFCQGEVQREDRDSLHRAHG